MDITPTRLQTRTRHLKISCKCKRDTASISPGVIRKTFLSQLAGQAVTLGHEPKTSACDRILWFSSPLSLNELSIVQAMTQKGEA